MANHAFNPQVVRLQKSIQSRMDIEIPTPVAQEAVAAVHGKKNWNTLVATTGIDNSFLGFEIPDTHAATLPESRELLLLSLDAHLLTKRSPELHKTSISYITVSSTGIPLNRSKFVMVWKKFFHAITQSSREHKTVIRFPIESEDDIDFLVECFRIIISVNILIEIGSQGDNRIKIFSGNILNRFEIDREGSFFEADDGNYIWVHCQTQPYLHGMLESFEYTQAGGD